MNREKTFKAVYGIEAPKAVLELYKEDLRKQERLNRENTFKAVYGAEAPKTVLELYKEDLNQVKRLSKSKQYQGLLELLLRYSYAIFYGYKTVSIINNRLKYRQEAMKVLNEDDVEKAFNNIIRAVEPKEPKQSEHAVSTSSNSCIAKDEIRRLKEELDTESYTLAKGQKEEDKRIFIKVALVALSTGARLKEITETLELSSKKDITYFTNGNNTEEGVILELDIRTLRAYLKDIRGHYKERIAKGTDIGRGIRKAVKRLNIPNCVNTNHLNALYRECLTSSPQ